MVRRRNRRPFWLIAVCLFSAGVCSQVSADAVHRFNERRTGYTPASLPPPYRLVWTCQPAHPPQPAWREPAWETQRIDLDYAYALSAGADLVYVANSANHAVEARELDSGELRWQYFTEGPVRLAPAVDGGCVYAASDDGYVHCLDGAAGSLRWRFRPAIPDERLIGNEQMISRWPSRSGVLVRGGRVYATFGMWSSEGIVVACLDGNDGSPIWLQDTSGTKYMTQPHFEAMGGVSPQGYLALSGDVLVVPCGRATPAFFDARTGELLYHESEGLFPGGAWTMTFGPLAFTPCEMLQKPNPEAPVGPEAPISEDACLVALRAETGEEVFHLRGALQGVIDDEGRMSLIGPHGLVQVALDDVVLAATPGSQAKIKTSEGHFVQAATHRRWAATTGRIYELIQAGEVLIAGGRGTLACHAAADGHLLWQTEVAGDVRELLVVGDSLLVGTTTGEIRCYRAGAGDPPRIVPPHARALRVPEELKQRAAGALEASGCREGYALVLGDVETTWLAALAEASQLTLYAAARGPRDAAPGETTAPAADDPQRAADEKLQAARQALDAAGLYGTRVAIHRLPAGPLPYADYCADAVFFAAADAAELAALSAEELHRVLRPCGGVAIVAFDDGLDSAVNAWLHSGGIDPGRCRRIPGGLSIERGPLPGAGQWTHQYGDAGKSSASDDTRVQLPLKVLWFGGIGPADIVSRHYRTPAPLVAQGRMFVAGMDRLHAVNAYNGRTLWTRELPGVGRWPAAYRGGSIAADDDSVYALQGRTCLRLDAASGSTRSVFQVPGGDDSAATDAAPDAVWEYLAVTPEYVVGTLGKPNIMRSWWSRAHPANRRLFVLSKATGEAVWVYEAEGEIDSSSIAIAENRVFLIDGLPAVEIFSRSVRTGAKSKPVYSSPGKPEERVLKALDLATGRELWRTRDVGSAQNSLWVGNGVIVSTIYPDPSVRGGSSGTNWRGPAISAFSAADGALLWQREESTPCSPVILGEILYLPDALQLRTGQPVLREDPLTGASIPFVPRCGQGCGKYSGCPAALMMRSGSLGLYDLKQRSGVYHVPNVRASCWINMVPAGGLVLVPEGSSSCPCAYNYKTSLALAPADRHNHWGLFGRALGREQDSSIARLRVNFGAPGDRPDGLSQIWFAWPRPATDGPRGAGGMGRVAFDSLPIERLDGEPTPAAVARNPDWTPIAGTDKPWLYANGLAGPFRLGFTLGAETGTLREYRVTLHFCELKQPRVSPGFFVRLQSETVVTGVQATGAEGQRLHAWSREVTVQADGKLTLEVSAGDDPASPPVLSGIEIVRID